MVAAEERRLAQKEKARDAVKKDAAEEAAKEKTLEPKSPAPAKSSS